VEFPPQIDSAEGGIEALRKMSVTVQISVVNFLYPEKLHSPVLEKGPTVIIFTAVYFVLDLCNVNIIAYLWVSSLKIVY